MIVLNREHAESPEVLQTPWTQRERDVARPAALRVDADTITAAAMFPTLRNIARMTGDHQPCLLSLSARARGGHLDGYEDTLVFLRRDI